MAPVTSSEPTVRPGDVDRDEVQTNDVVERLRLAVARLQRRLRQQAMGDLTLTHLSCLSAIGRMGPLPLGDLAAQERLSPPTVTKVTTKLQEAGLVERLGDPTDRRVSLVSVTAAGRRKLEEVRTRRSAWLHERLDELSAADLDRLAAALDVLEGLAADCTPNDATADALADTEASGLR